MWAGAHRAVLLIQLYVEIDVGVGRVDGEITPLAQEVLGETQHSVRGGCIPAKDESTLGGEAFVRFYFTLFCW